MAPPAADSRPVPDSRPGPDSRAVLDSQQGPDPRPPPTRTLAAYLKTLLASRRMPPVLCLFVLSGFMEGASLLLLVPLLGALGIEAGSGAAGAAAQWIKSWIESALQSAGFASSLGLALGAYASAAAAQVLLRRSQTVLHLRLQQDLVAALRARLHSAISRASWLFLSRSRSSDFTHLLTGEVERVGAATYHLLGLASGLVLTAVHLTLALRISPGLTGAAAATAGVLLFLLRRKTRSASAAGEELGESLKSLYAVVQQHLDGMKTAKAHGVEERHREVFAEVCARVRSAQMSTARNQAGARCRFELGSAAGLCVLVYLSLRVFDLAAGDVVLSS